MHSLAEAPYGDQVVFPDRMLIEDPDEPEGWFPGASWPVLVLLIENQGVCAWGVPLASDDDPPVLVGGDLNDGGPLRAYAPNVASFVECRRWDRTCLDRAPVLQAQAEELDAGVLDFLRTHFDERSTTLGWPCAKNYRFERAKARIMLCSCRGQCDWWISADTDDALREALSLIVPVARLREFLWSNDTEGVQLLADLGITSC